jgi:hypothetical protein
MGDCEMRPADEIEHSVRNMSFKAGPEMDQQIWAAASRAQEKSHDQTPAQNRYILRRIAMNTRIVRFAAVAIIIIAVTFGLTTLLDHGTTAYALDQTIEANHTVRYLYIRDFDEIGGEPQQFWLEFDESGQPLNARMEFPKTEDGPKVTVLNQDIAHVWFKAKNFLMTVRDRDDIAAKHILAIIIESDPKLMVERLRQAEAKGRVKLQIAEPSSKSEPIVVTATYLLKNGKPSGRDVLTVDPTTKLVSKKESCALVDGKYKLTSWQEFLNYNEAIDPKTFTIDAPDNVVRVDQTTQMIGLAKGDLTDEQIAVKVARQFFEALIAEDYAAAGKLVEGMPADWIEQQFGQAKYIRIVLVDKPTAHPIPETRFLRVPCKIELEINGVREIKEFVPNIRPVYGDPDRWTIGGGVP